MVNEKLKQARFDEGMTLLDVAIKLNITTPTYHQWEQGKKYPKLEYREKLCELFNKSASELGFAE